MIDADNRRSEAQLAAALDEATGHHRAGRLAEAELLYFQILRDHPENADAMHLLGVIAMQCGQPLRAIETIDKAIKLAPDVSTYHTNLCEAYRTAGNFERSRAAGETAVRLDPTSAPAQVNLGLTLQNIGRLDDAVARYERAIELDPWLAQAYVNLANLLVTLERPYEAAAMLLEGKRLMGEVGTLNAALDQVQLVIKTLEAPTPPPR